MTETVNKGLLTDKEGTGFPGCRITVDGKDTPFVVLNFVQKYLDSIPKNTPVCFTTKDGKISKIWQDKEAASSSEKPAVNPATPSDSTGLKTVEGQIVAIDKPAHKITVKDRDGVSHTFVWPPTLDADFSKLNQWWFTKVTGEHETEFDIWKATSQGFFKRPDDWPFAKPTGKGGYGQPRNERAIIMQVCFKEACETARQQMRMSEKFDAAEADAAWEWALDKTEKSMGRLCTVGGV
jgi:hypothetical protein